MSILSHRGTGPPSRSALLNMQHGNRVITHRANRLLAALEPEDFAVLEPHLEFIELQNGKVIYEAGAPITHAYFPHKAIVSLLTILDNGGTVEMAGFGREAMFGYVSAVVKREALGRYVTQLAGSASRISIERLDGVSRENVKIRQMIQNFTEALMVQTLQTVACNAVHSVEARCCRWILSTHDRLDQDALPLTHEVLAEMLGVQRSTVSSATRTLQTAGLIQQGRGVITVTDRAGLEEMTCECYHAIRGSFERLLPKTYPKFSCKS